MMTTHNDQIITDTAICRKKSRKKKEVARVMVATAHIINRIRPDVPICTNI